MTASLALAAVLTACAGHSEPSDIHQRIKPISSPVDSSSPLRGIERGVGIFKSFSEEMGLKEIKKGAAYSVGDQPTISGHLNFAVSSDFGNTHFQTLLNFMPYPAFVSDQAKLDHVDFQPKGLTEYRVPVEISVSDLRSGTNCLVFVIAEDPRVRIRNKQQTNLTGLRVDIVVGEPSPNGCGWDAENSEMTAEVFDRTVGSLETATSIADDRVAIRYEATRSKLPRGRVFTRLSDHNEQRAALVLLSDGMVASHKDLPLVRSLTIPAEPRELRVSAPVPNLSREGSAIAFFLIPNIDKSLIDVDPGGMQPRGWNQVLITP